MDSDISVKHNMHGGTGTGRGEGKWEDKGEENIRAQIRYARVRYSIQS